MYLVNVKAGILLPSYVTPASQCLMSIFDPGLRGRNYVNGVVQVHSALPQWLTMAEAVVNCTEGIGI